MPMYKVWNAIRTLKKAVAVNTLEELLVKGKEKLDLLTNEECRVFDEADGTEIDDDDCLLSYEKGSIFVIGRKWIASDQVPVKEEQVTQSQGVLDETQSKKFLHPAKEKSSLDAEDRILGSDDSFGDSELITEGEENKSLFDIGDRSFGLDDFGNSNLTTGDDTSFDVKDRRMGLGDMSFGNSELTAEGEGDISFDVEDRSMGLGDSFGNSELTTEGEEGDISFDIEDRSMGLGDSFGNSELTTEDEEGDISFDVEDRSMGLGDSFGDGKLITEDAKKRDDDVLVKGMASKRKASELNNECDWIGEEPRSKKLFTTILMENKYKHAKMKKLKIFSNEEISAVTGMEKKRREFWNGKAEQLASKAKTASLSKTVIAGIIDVSWTLRKTCLIEEEATRVNNNEEIFLKNESTKKDRMQKKETLPKNLERLSSAHAVVVDVNEKMERFRLENARKSNMSKMEEYKKIKTLLDAAYSELKKAQDATTKAINVKKKLLDQGFKSKRNNDIM